jgi:peptidoglycan/LPS O-acetylase OafA/YrhL
MANSSQERIHGPDILRGFAASGVILFHLHLLAGITITPAIAAICGKFGSFVPLFFAISAFSLAYSYNERMNCMEDIKFFYIKRFFRLAPLFYAVLIVEYLATYIMYKHLFSGYELLLSLTYTFPFIPGKHESLVWGGWSLGVEWIFYIIFPVMVCFLNNKKTTFLAWFISLILSINIQKDMAITQPELQSFYYMNIIKHLPYFVVGIGVSHYFKEFKMLAIQWTSKSRVISGSIILLTILGVVGYFRLGLYPAIYYELVASIMWFVLLGASIIGLPRVLDNSFTRFLGKASYSIYLLHPIVVIGFRTCGFFKYIEKTVEEPTVVFLIISAITIGSTFIISALSFKYIETSGMKFGKSVIKNIAAKEWIRM